MVLSKFVNLMWILFGFWSDVRFQVVVVARRESQPAVQAASCAGCELCGREPDLPAFSTDAHTLQCVCAISCFTLNFHKLIRLGQHISDDICYDI